MNSLFFAFQLVFVLLIVVWAMRNDRVGDADAQPGLFAVRQGLPAEPREPGRLVNHRKTAKTKSKNGIKSRKK